MKRFYTLILLVATPIIGFSQAIISNLAPNFGDQFILSQAEAAPSPGPAGANLTWDFSNETIDEYTGSYTVMTPEEVDGSENFPDATMVWTADLGFGAMYSFMSFDNNTFTIYGSQTQGSGFSTSLIYSDPIDHFTYPLVYQNTGSDDYGGSLTGISGGNIISGSESYIVDGYGTVITPYGTYENVLRVTSTGTETMSVFDIEMVTSSTESIWYSPDYSAPVMIIRSAFSSTMGTPTDTTRSISALVSYTPASTTGLANRDNSSAFSIYPNPASDRVTVTFENASANSILKIYSSNGKLVEIINNVQSNHKVDVSSLSPGIYIAVLLVDGQQDAQKPFSIVR